jgi:hypothetical protein
MLSSGRVGWTAGNSARSASECEGGEEAREAVIGDGEVVAAGPMPNGAGEPTLADAAGSRDQKIVASPDPVAGYVIFSPR